MVADALAAVGDDGGAQVSGFSRSKGARGEREVCAIIRDLLGFDARRRVRQHEGDSDVLGVPGWAIESKNCATLDLPAWWRQAVEQAGDSLPALFYKVPRRGWRVRWPLSAVLVVQRADDWLALDWTADTSPAAWAAVVREGIE